uniref:DZF domain-containing protein n=1 Tax=Romanomermis culicivorax TaxID=13658 RepID=A0A915IJA9_ROMCU
MDPCEKTPTDVLASLTGQQREDITASAQHMLRMFTFNQLHTILGVEKMENSNGQRKRPFGDVEMAEESNGKKDKKEI